MNTLEKAKQLVRNAKLSDNLIKLGESQFTFYKNQTTYYVNPSHYENHDEYLLNGMTADILADSLDVFIDLTEVEVGKESEIPIGASKIKGCPDLPKEMDWPAGLYFAAQLNCAEMNKADSTDFFPNHGMLYLFFNHAGEEEILLGDGSITELERRTYPPADQFEHSEYYYKAFKDGFAGLKMASVFIFNIDDGLNAEYLPDELINNLSDLLNARFISESPNFSIFGRPQYWQGEDEDGAEMYQEDPIEALFRSLVMQDIMTMQEISRLYDENGYFSEVTDLLQHLLEQKIISQSFYENHIAESVADNTKDKTTVLLFQDEIDDVNVHFWVEKDAFNKNDFSNSRASYSGT